MIDLALWEPYLEAFTRMLRADDPLVARAHREEMSAYIEASPDFWRGEALRTGLHERPKLEVTGWYMQVSRSRWSWR